MAKQWLKRSQSVSLPAPDRLQREERLRELAPKRRLITAKTVHDLVVQIGQAEEADRDGARGAHRARSGIGGDKFPSMLRTAENILFEVASRERRNGDAALPLLIWDWLQARASERAENLALHPQEPGLDRGRPSQPPKQRCEAMHEFPLDGGLRHVLRNDRFLERPVFLGAFERFDDGLGREPVSQRVTPGLLLSVLGIWAGALERVLAVRLYLAEGRHGRFDSAAASGAAPPLFAALLFGVSSVECGKDSETLGACDLSLATGCGAAFGRVASQSSRAIWIGSIRAVFHHSGSLRARWSSRWCRRQSGTVNSSLTLRPKARFWAKRRWCGSEGWRPQNAAGSGSDVLHILLVPKAPR